MKDAHLLLCPGWDWDARMLGDQALCLVSHLVLSLGPLLLQGGVGKRAFVLLQLLSKDQIREKREQQIKEIMSGYTVLHL